MLNYERIATLEAEVQLVTMIIAPKTGIFSQFMNVSKARSSQNELFERLKAQIRHPWYSALCEFENPHDKSGERVNYINLVAELEPEFRGRASAILLEEAQKYYCQQMGVKNLWASMGLKVLAMVFFGAVCEVRETNLLCDWMEYIQERISFNELKEVEPSKFKEILDEVYLQASDFSLDEKQLAETILDSVEPLKKQDKKIKQTQVEFKKLTKAFFVERVQDNEIALELINNW